MELAELGRKEIILEDNAHSALSGEGAVYGCRPPQQKYTCGKPQLEPLGDAPILVVLQFLR